jgi:iron complex outermembrane receptor protein
MLLGGNFAGGKGNATLFFNYRHAEQVQQGQRNFSACALSSNATGLVCGGGSNTNATGYFYGAPNFTPYTVADAAGNIRPSTPADAYNFAPPNFFQRPETQYSFNAFAHYDALPNVRVYGEFDFSNSQSVAQIAAGGIFIQDLYTLRDSNPLLSQQFKDVYGITPTQDATIYIGRRNVEGGGRQEDFTLEDYRYVLGAKGAVWEDTWNYNFWWQSGTNRLSEVTNNYFSRAKINKALDVVTDPATGRPACASFVDGTDPACVPYDVFHKGGITPAALAYLTTPAFRGGTTSQSVVGFQIDSDLGQSYGWRTPWAKNGAAVAFGIERRVEKLQFASDAALQSGDLSGSGGASPAVDNQYTVVEYYAEGRLPIMERQDWAYLLNINASYRNSNYNQPDNTTNTYGLGAEWAPVKEYKARGTYQRAIRAPNIIELYTPAGLNLFNMSTDPCGKSAAQPTPTASLVQCLRSGLDPSRYGTTGLISPTGQYQFGQGGNPNLKPETADTWTLGLVAQPLPNLSGTVDWWSIRLKDAIGVVPQPLILQNCLLSGLFCDQVHRDAAGTLWRTGFIGGITTNTGALDTDGVDVTVNWNQPLDTWGSLGVSLVGTYVNSYKFTIGTVSADCAGYFGVICGNPIPVWRSKVRGTWNTPWYSTAVALTWRYFDSVKLDSTQDNPALATGSFPADQKLGSQNYIDLALSWNINKNFTMYIGANNIFDKDPPILSQAIAGPPFGNGNTYPQVYDTLGRNLFVQLTAKF